MIRRMFLLWFISLALLSTSFCVHRSEKARFLSSSEGSFVDNEIVNVPTDRGHRWIITKKTYKDPVGVVDLAFYYKCKGDRKPNAIGEVLRVADKPLPPVVSGIKSWGELEGTQTYRNHKGVEKNQDLKLVIVAQFYPVPEMNFTPGYDQTPLKANTAKQVVLDISKVCP